jgi:protocatechuate 3,4-dioxygenase beta subunit
MPVIASLHQTTLSANWAESQFLTRSDDRGEYRIFGLPAGSYKVRAGSVSSSRPLSLTDSLTNAAERSGDAPAATETDLRRSGVVPMFSGGMRLGDWLLSTTGAAAVGLAGFSTGGGLTVYRSAFFGGPGHLPTAVHVKPGDERLGVDLVLDRVQAVPLTGRLIAPPGLAEHVALQLVSGTVDALERNDALDVASTVTSPGGEFSFLGVPAGEYLVMARKTSGGSAGPTVADAGPRAPEEVLWALEPIVSNELQTVHHRVQLRPGLSIAGRIRFDDAPQNARDVRIAVDPVGVAPRRTETRARVAADVSGHFRTGPLLPGLYRLRAAGPAGSTLATVMRGGKELPGGVLALRTDVNDLELRFVRSGTLVEGSVLDRQGRTAGRATVILFSASPEAWNAFETRRLQTAATSDEGRYAFREVPPGEYFLIALADASFPEDWRSSETLARLMPVSKRVTIVAGRHEMVMLREQKP